MAAPGSPDSRSSGLVLAVDIGGTKIAAALVDSNASVLVERQVPTPMSDDPNTVFDAVAGVVDDLVAQAPHAPDVCGVGCGGPMRLRGETVSPLNIPAWREFPLLQRLEHLTGLLGRGGQRRQGACPG